jgi:hypothetical protein
MYANSRHFKENTRIFLNNAAGHLEGCLLWLTKTPPKYRSSISIKPFGGLVYELFKNGILTEETSNHLLTFNRLVNVPAKHITAYYKPRSRLDERTFSCLETVLGFITMRKLSIQLFKILKEKGICLPQDWPEFDDYWLSPIWSSIEHEDDEESDEDGENEANQEDE